MPQLFKNKAKSEEPKVIPTPAGLSSQPPPDPAKQSQLFIVDQIRASLAYLQEQQCLREATCLTINTLIDDDLNPNRLGPKNKWVREQLGNEEAVAEMLDQILGVAGLSFLQTEAITQILAAWVPKVGTAATNPQAQQAMLRAAGSSTKAVARGYKATAEAMKRRTQAQKLAQSGQSDDIVTSPVEIGSSMTQPSLYAPRARPQKLGESITEYVHSPLRTEIRTQGAWNGRDADVVIEQLDSETKSMTSSFSPYKDSFITSVVVFHSPSSASTSAFAEAEEDAPLPTEAASEALPGRGPPVPPPRHPRTSYKLEVEDGYDPPVPPRRAV